MPTAASLRNTFAPPPLTLLAMEPLRAALDFFASKFATHANAVGDGHPVVVFPGLGGAPFTTSHLRRYLKDSGFTTHCWGRGVNTGPEGVFDDWLGVLADDVHRWSDTSGSKVSLVGWSLGGIYARELAKRCPDRVRQVITLGTPFAAMRGATHAEGIYKLLNGNMDQLTPKVAARLRECPPVPTSSIYSKTDGVVCWRGCIPRKSAQSESIEVAASHLGMVTHPEVLRILADRLSQPEGQWKPLRRNVRLRPSARAVRA